MTTHTVTFTVNGHTYTGIRSGYAECDECRKRIYARSRTEAADGMTAHDWQQARDMAAERAQRADDTAFYG